MSIVRVLLALFFAVVALNSRVVLAADADRLSVSSVGRNSKLVLKTDLMVPANSQDLVLGESSRGDGRIVSTCSVNMRESSLDRRVLRSAAEIVFSGQVAEGIDGTWQFHTLDVSQPEAIKSVTCYAEYLDTSSKWHPTMATIGDLKSAFSGVADLHLPEPVEIPNP